MNADGPIEWPIELLRGCAAFLVLVAHYQTFIEMDFGVFRFSFSGVDLFFVLSGYVFAPYLFGRKIVIAPFLTRRFFRLYPLYAVALISYAWLRWQPDLSPAYLVRHALFLHTVESREIAFHFNSAFWSLPPEIEFYLLLPALAFLAGNIRRVFAITALALILHLAVNLHLPPSPAINIAYIFSIHLPGLLIEFMLGVIAWWAARRCLRRTVWLGMAILGAGIWLALAKTFALIGDAGVEQDFWLRGNMGLMAAFSFALVLAAWVNLIETPPQWLIRLATGLGKLSYGTYLFHNAMPLVLNSYQHSMPGIWFALLCLACTVVVAQMLYWLWEAPCRRLGRNLGQQLDAAHQCQLAAANTGITKR